MTAAGTPKINFRDWRKGAKDQGESESAIAHPTSIFATIITMSKEPDFPPSSQKGDEEPVVNFRPILPGVNTHLYRSSAPEAAALKTDDLNEAEDFALHKVNLILDLRAQKEGNLPLKQQLVERGSFEEIFVDKKELPSTFDPSKRYMMRLDFLGHMKNIMTYIDKNWLQPNELDGLDEKAVFQKRRSSFNSRGLTGMNVIMLEQQESVLAALQLLTIYLEQVPDAKVLVHCTAGKDRTGMTCMLLQNLAGFSVESMITEYTLSEVEASEIMARVTKHHKDSFLDPKVMGGADKAGIQGALSHIRDTYGSFDQYFDEIGFDKTWRQRAKAVLIKQT